METLPCKFSKEEEEDDDDDEDDDDGKDELNGTERGVTVVEETMDITLGVFVTLIIDFIGLVVDDLTVEVFTRFNNCTVLMGVVTGLLWTTGESIAWLKDDGLLEAFAMRAIRSLIRFCVMLDRIAAFWAWVRTLATV